MTLRRRGTKLEGRLSLPAKLTRPEVLGVLRRDRLFRRLDDQSVRWAWITGPPGSGKTSLVSSWLEARDLPAFWYRLDGEDNQVSTLFGYLRRLVPRALDLEAPSPSESRARLALFARRFFEAWCTSMAGPFAVVFDDCQEIEPDSPCSAVFAGALSALSPGALLVCISRQAPPGSLARFTAGSGFLCPGAEELRFSDAEALELARSWHIDDLAGARRANAVSRGWAYGLASLLRGNPSGLSFDKGRAEQAIFDYFATEVLAKLPAELQKFLLSTCILPQWTIESARELSGHDDAVEMVAFLHRHGLFLDRSQSASADGARYQYCPLFRDFLLARARQTWTAPEWERLNQRANALLEAGDESIFAPCIADLEHFLATEDGAMQEETAVAASRSGHGLLIARPDDRLLPPLAERAVTLARRLRVADQRIAAGAFALHYFVWTGKLARAKALLAELDGASDEASSGSRMSLAQWSHRVIEEEDGAEAALALLESTLEIAHRLVSNEPLEASLRAEIAETALRAGRLAVAATALGTGWPRRGVADWRTLRLQFLRAASFLMRDDAAEAVRIGREAWRWAPADSPWPYWDAVFHGWFGVMLMQNGQHAEAREHLGKTLVFARRMPSTILAFDALLALAFSHLDAGERDVGLTHLREAFGLGAEHGYRAHRLFFTPRVLAQLSAWALESDIEPVYVRSLIQLRRLQAPDLDSQGWPWPVRIYTLGRFAVEMDQRELSFSRKAPQKPLQLLKALIARGGRAVDHRDLSEQLWPDLEGDASRNALDIALHRLRKLLDSDRSITIQEGKVTFDTGYVWVDAWAFERLSGAIDRWRAETISLDDVNRAAERLLRSYTGHFLAGEDGTWAITTRERLRSRFLRAVSRIAQHLEISGLWDEVSTLFHRAIELDPLTEEFHLGLIKCFGRQHRIAEALCAYRRCRALLSANLGVEPSGPTRAAYLSLRTLAAR